MVLQRGFTLLELIIALGITLILANGVLFAARDWVERIRTEAQVDRFLTLVHAARAAAIVHNTSVTLCPGTRDHAPDVCGARNTWHQGALAFIDRDGDRQLDSEDMIIGEQAQVRRLKIYWRAFRSRSYLRFTGTGVTDWQNGHFLFCPEPTNATLARQVILNYAGRTYRSADRNGDGIHENASGQPFSCPT